MNATALCARSTPWLVHGTLVFLVVGLGGSLYEHLVVDPVWPRNIVVIQPEQGGVDRKHFWIPLHGALTLALPAALWACWPRRTVRRWLAVALGAYVARRVWTFLYFIPRALRFESAPALSDSMVHEAQTWVWLSVLRAPMLILACVALWMAGHQLESEPSAGKETT
jgi:hypothetical protein